MADEEIKQLQNKRKKLISQQKQEERKKRDKRIYEKGAVFESIFIESKNLTKDKFYQLITSLIRKEEANLKIQKIIESREETEVENTEKEDEETDIEEQSLVYKDTEKKIDDRVQLIDHAEKYLKHKDTYKAYTKLKKSKQDTFYNEHTAEIILFESAKKYLKEHLGESKTLNISK